MAIPKSGTYTLTYGTIGNAPLNQTIAAPKTARITWGNGYVEIDGKKVTYTAVFGGSPSTQGWGNLNIVILQLNGGYMVIGDTSVNLSAYTYMLNNATTTNTQIAVKRNAVTTPIATWGFNKGAGGMWDGKCFLPGTLISTPTGHIAVEDIVPGTEVLAFDKEGSQIVRQVRWVGKNHVSRQPWDGELDKCPIRIKKSALAENVPFKDCLLTSEHCLFLNDNLVPVRMLVNSKSIYKDTEICEYDYYHISLDDHSILQSDGLFSESYLKTDESTFDVSVGEEALPGKAWERDAAAPLNTDADFVKPLYQYYLSRAEELDFPLTERKIIEPTTIEIMDEHGNVIRSSRKDGNKYFFLIGKRSENIIIRSSCGKPSEVIGPFFDDRRMMGVLVGNIEITSAKGKFSYSDHLQNEELFGWHASEDGKHRWTTGNAQLLNLGDYEDYILSIEVIDHSPSVTRIDLLWHDTESDSAEGSRRAING